MPVLTDAELRIIAELGDRAAEIARHRLRQDQQGHIFARAALIDSAFKARLAEIHRRLEARGKTDLPRKMLSPLAPFFRDLERDAEAVLSGWKAP